MKNKKGLVIGIIAIIIIVAIAFAALYFATDLFKTNKQLFYKYISKAQIMNANFSKMYTETNKKISESNYSSNGQLDFSMSMPNIQTGNMETQTVFSIKSNGLENKTLKQSYKDLTLSTNNQNILTLKYIRDDNTYALGADNILAKYVAVENANLKELFTKLGVEDVSAIPDSISTNNFEELLKIDDQTLETLTKTYYSVLDNNINDVNYFKTKNADGTEAIGISLSEQEVAQLIKTVLETAKNDTVLLNLIVNKAQLIGYNEITAETIQTGIQNLLDEMTDIASLSSNSDFVKLSLYKRDKQVIGLQFETKVEGEQANNEDNASEIGEYTPNDIQLPQENNFIAQAPTYSCIKIDFSEANKIVFSAKEDDVEILLITMNYSYSANSIDLNMQFESKATEGENGIASQTPILQLQYKLSGYQSDTITENCIINIINQGDTQSTYQMNTNRKINK